MNSRRRWSVVVVGTLVVLLLPFLVGRLPAGNSEITASTLLARIEASGDVPYSGYVEADGGLDLPVSDSTFNDLADLLGGQTTMRVWWRGTQDWRVDSVTLTGETDLAQDATGLWTWEYEGNRAQRSGNVGPESVRLPRADDLLPPTLARRLLAEARPSEVTRLPNARVAGEQAAGLRLRPSLPQATVDHVDVWALPSSGLPLRVEVYDRNGDAAMRTTMLDLSADDPPASTTAFAPPPRAYTGARFGNSAPLTLLGPVRPPGQLGGLTRSPNLPGRFSSVGVYGRGVTILVAVPLPPQAGDFLERQLTGTVAAPSDGGAAAALEIGPISLRLTARAGNGTRWLLAGTVTPGTLADAEDQLPVIERFSR